MLFQTFNVSPQFFCCFKFVIIKEIGIWYRFKQADATGLTSRGFSAASQGGHTALSHDPQQPGFKRDPNNNKRQSKNEHVNWQKVVVDTSGLSGRRHHHGELICHLSQKVTKMEAGLIKKATRKVKRRTRR